MKTFLIIVQIISALILTFLILSQSKGTGLSNVFGGGTGVYRTKRGFEKVLHYLTIFMAILFFTVPVLIILVS